MKVFLGADHGGFKLKEEAKLWLKEWNIEFEDLGSEHYIIDDDYPDYAWKVAMKVSSEPKSLGILACRSGQGQCITANKAKGIRAAVAWNEKSAHAARYDDDANVLCLPADYLTIGNAKNIVHMFLMTEFASHEERFVRRVNKIKKIDINL